MISSALSPAMLAASWGLQEISPGEISRDIADVPASADHVKRNA
jgi:hypothetical protein